MNIAGIIKFVFLLQFAASVQGLASRLATLDLADVPEKVINSGVLNKTVVFGYTYETAMNVSQIPWESLTHLVLAFFQINAAGDVTTANGNLSTIINPAHRNGVKVIASIGGSGDGSVALARALDAKEISAHMIESVIENIKRHNLDGIDIDYEFPETPQQIKSLYSALKSTRYALDSAFGKGQKILTTTLFSSNGRFGPNVPQVNAKPFSDIVDYGLLMSYDYFGSFSQISAPNSPFYDVPGYPGLSFTSSIAAWLSAGWDAEKLVAGLAYYGRTAIVSSKSAQITQFMPNSGAAPPGGPIDKIAGAWTWADLRDPTEGALIAPAEARQGWQRFWDNGTQTPWLFHLDSQTYIGYDDIDSLSVKANHIITEGLAGAMVWMVQYDYGRELESVVQSYSSVCSRIFRQALEQSELSLLDSDGQEESEEIDNSKSMSHKTRDSGGIISTHSTFEPSSASCNLYRLSQAAALAILAFAAL
ncbi:hypothetical protein LPJ64_002617 [Coemansia asiatica]|uniref:GH18 domain-containing protein n=1 Tax=Coemansia asiatica TaxID=1052880 RepID=A0A9W8CJJ2_9FUNG|nr:hypothetical protein LPJ64_002617 [Coemansia asiatica]